jgi:hypothetical protein
MRIVVSSGLGPANKSLKWLISNYIQSLEEGQILVGQISPDIQNLSGIFEFRLYDNLVRTDYQDLTILAHDYNYIKNNLAYIIKYSIYGRLFKYKELASLNPEPPEIEVEVYEILPAGHSGFLSSEELNDIADTIISETRHFWKSDVLTR